MWPQIDKKKGNWFPAGLDSQNLHGLQGYKVFISIAIILGDGLYNFVKILYKTLDALYKTYKSRELPVVKQDGLPALSYDEEERRTQVFLKDRIPIWIPFGGYLGLGVVSILLVCLLIFHPLKWYYMLIILIFAPILGFCNAYGCGLTDWSLATTYGKLAIFIIGAWAGSAHGGVLAGLAACGVMLNIVSTASDLMQDFKTGYLTLSSPKSMLVSQAIGTAMGCVISPCVFYFFLKANKDLGAPGSAYPAPYALVYRNIAILGVEGFSSLPKHCLIFCYAFFAGAILVNIIRDLVGKKWSKWIPVPMAMAIPFYLGGYFTLDMCLGSLILFIWQQINKAKADTYTSAVASGMICGDGIWSLPSALLSLFGVQAPFCIRVP
ncbi:Metal-nicotianamine transporter ysl2 [Thalictrum thalictroides]|uniref:Metal-nicotianamine transporter ysl2 n=1 Tax=Thalictrum thalictroides TaxID=46969 RepID=A0A7J6WDX3_THATH|nr:Metal-nicotianamine transporter ysl2 [Thalictrum thalictroides]